MLGQAVQGGSCLGDITAGDDYLYLYGQECKYQCGPILIGHKVTAVV
jgi:hypothetical protein